MMARNQASMQDGELEDLPCFRESFLGGMRTGTGLGVAVFVLGLTFGALARADGWGSLPPWLVQWSSSQALRNSHW
jgi:hypothetical protein